MHRSIWLEILYSHVGGRPEYWKAMAKRHLCIATRRLKSCQTNCPVTLEEVVGSL